MDKKQRFRAAYEYIYSIGAIHSQKDLAEKMGAAAPNISNALKGMSSVLTDRFLIRFAKAFPIFDANWLLSGDGKMLNADVPLSPPPPSATKQGHEHYTIEASTASLLQQVANQLAEIGEMRASLREAYERLSVATEEMKRSRADFDRAANRLEVFASHYGSGDINIAAEEPHSAKYQKADE
jgi:transcriptional regulator with XRE-family HTH domain